MGTASAPQGIPIVARYLAGVALLVTAVCAGGVNTGGGAPFHGDIRPMAGGRMAFRYDWTDSAQLNDWAPTKDASIATVGGELRFGSREGIEHRVPLVGNVEVTGVWRVQEARGGSEPSCCVGIQCTPKGNYHLILKATDQKLYKDHGPNVLRWAKGAFPDGKPHTFRFVRAGDSLKAWIDGKLWIDTADADHRGGCVRLSSWHADVGYRNIQIVGTVDPQWLLAHPEAARQLKSLAQHYATGADPADVLAEPLDVLTEKATGKVEKGKLLGTVERDGQRHLLLKTADGEQLSLPAAEWEARQVPIVKPVTVGFVQVETPLEAEEVADVVVRAIDSLAKRGTPLVVIEIDTPGGVIEFAERICRAIEGLAEARVVAFVKGGPQQGAFSAGALVALACDAVFMSERCSIGAATPYIATKQGPQFSEKMTSAFSATFRALAEKHRRPAAVAWAMVDPDVELREVTFKGARLLVAGDRAVELSRAGAQLGPWVTRKGKLLTLTAREASALGLADGVVNNREELRNAIGLVEWDVIDLDTTRTLRPWLAILAERRRAATSDPRAFQYRMKVVYPDVFVDGQWLPGPNPREQFADGGRLWRERTGLCGRHVDRCLSRCQAYMKKARSSPGVWVDEARVTATVRELKQWRKRLLDEQLRFW